ncbi:MULTISPECIES: SRPBCC family protein [unclassified Nocardioides]|uniref:SRPBCC family protein n=1 Tax=unclassified Nocardioides TaxID=2615069 RepID=UPI00360C4602
MLLTNRFTVPVPIDRAWDTLLDMERVAPCLPGAAVDSFDGEVCQGRVKVKVGPISLQYRGEVTIDERDDAQRRLVMTGLGKEVKGSSSASARIRANLVEQGTATEVQVETELDLTGKPAQFGRGIITDVSNRLIGTFATNLEGLLTAEEPAPVAAATTAPSTPAPPITPVAEPDALDALSLLPEPVRRVAPVAGGVLIGVVLGWLLRRR